MRLLALLLATLASAALYGLAFPPTAHPLLAWVALVPFLVAVRNAPSVRMAAFLGWAWQGLMAYAVADWLPRAVATYYEQPAIVGVAFFFGVFSIMGAPYYVAFAAWYRALGGAAGRAWPLLVAAAWVAAELGRGKPLTANPWALLGYSQVDVKPLIQIADVTGVYGVSFVLAAVNAALAESWLALGRPGPAVRRAAAGLGAAALTVAAVAGYGVLRLREAPAADAGSVAVAIAQGNLDLGSQWRQELYGRNLDVYLRLTADVERQEPAPLVVWPENAMTFFVADEPLYRRALGRLLTPLGAELLAGGPRSSGGDAPVYHNSTFLLGPDGEIVASYDKQYLLPFAEYFPFARLDFLRRRFARVRVFTSGDAPVLLPTVAGRAGVVICNEAVFPEIVAARVRAGADFLVNLANDTWLGDRKYSLQAFDVVTFRAVEQRRFLVRASTAGPSAVIDPWGRVTVRTEPFTRAAVVGRVAPRQGLTPYARVGDAFAFGATVVALAALLRRWRGGAG